MTPGLLVLDEADEEDGNLCAPKPGTGGAPGDREARSKKRTGNSGPPGVRSSRSRWLAPQRVSPPAPAPWPRAGRRAGGRRSSMRSGPDGESGVEDPPDTRCTCRGRRSPTWARWPTVRGRVPAVNVGVAENEIRPCRPAATNPVLAARSRTRLAVVGGRGPKRSKASPSSPSRHLPAQTASREAARQRTTAVDEAAQRTGEPRRTQRPMTNGRSCGAAT